MSRVTKKDVIYLDNAASTPIDNLVKEEMIRTMSLFGNPSSFNDAGRAARKKLEGSRRVIAGFLGARPEEIIFTSSGSEANNLAILGLAGIFRRPSEIIATPIEHPSVIAPLKHLKKEGWKITYLKVNKEGIVDVNDLGKRLNPKVVLVSVMYANNEIGTIQPMKQISKIIRDFKSRIYNQESKIYPLFHTDACQAAGYLDMNVNNLGIELLTFNGAKIYGPRGVAVLYKKRGVPLLPQIIGGDQEYGLRAGTENLPAIAGLAKAVSIIDAANEGRRLASIRDYFIERIKTVLPEARLNGPRGYFRMPNNINISIRGMRDEVLLLELDKHRIYASSGSACTSRSVEPSHVLKAIGVSKDYIHGALRFSLGRDTGLKDMEFLLRILPQVIKSLRKRYII